jgi:hypothetical protein
MLLSKEADEDDLLTTCCSSTVSDANDEDRELHEDVLRDWVDLEGKLKTMEPGPDEPEDDPGDSAHDS